MSILDWLRGRVSGLTDEDRALVPAIERAQELLARGADEEALAQLPSVVPTDRELLTSFLYVKIQAALRMRDLLCLEGMALHAETLGELQPDKARHLMLEAEALGALSLAKALAGGISKSGHGAGEDLVRIQNTKAKRVDKEGYLTIAHTALQHQYRDIRLVGLGRQSYVVSALPHDREYRVAVKFLGPKAYLDERGRKRFEREVESLSRLDHPNVLKVLGYHFEEPPYMITEFFGGADLASLLAQGRAFFPIETARIGVSLCEAVAYAHKAGVFHRNIQPGNVLMNYDNKIKLIDFGMARLADSMAISSFGMVLGEWAYLPPERFAGDAKASAEQDVFGIGATLYHLVTRKPPFTRGKGLLRETSPPVEEVAPSLPGGLKRAISKALAEDPMDRWGSAEELLAVLKTVV